MGNSDKDAIFFLFFKVEQVYDWSFFLANNIHAWFHLFVFTQAVLIMLERSLRIVLRGTDMAWSPSLSFIFQTETHCHN